MDFKYYYSYFNPWYLVYWKISEINIFSKHVGYRSGISWRISSLSSYDFALNAIITLNV